MFGESIPYRRILVEGSAIVIACFFVIFLDETLHTATPAAVLGYVLGVTSFSRFRWLKTGVWQWPS